jgi:hypothetical protein
MTRAAVSVLASILLAGALAACAAGDDGPGGGPGGGQGGRRAPQGPLPNVFVSPEGKPFHAPRDAPYPVAAWFAEADTNHDGKLTREEFRQDAAAFFKVLDIDHNGVLDGEEVSRYEDSVAPEILPNVGHLRANEGMDTTLKFDRDERNQSRQGRGGYREPRQPGPANIEILQGAGLFSLLNEPEPVAAADTQFDGRITLQEFEAAADRRFDLLDTKQLGYLTLATLPKTPVQKEIERRAKLKKKHPGGPHPDGDQGPPDRDQP